MSQRTILRTLANSELWIIFLEHISMLFTSFQWYFCRTLEVSSCSQFTDSGFQALLRVGRFQYLILLPAFS